MNGRQTAFRIVVKLPASVLTEKISDWTMADDMTFYLFASFVFGDDGDRLRRLEKRFQHCDTFLRKLFKTRWKWH